MANGWNIRAVEEEAANAAPVGSEDTLELHTPLAEDGDTEWEEPTVRLKRWYDWFLPVVFGALIAGWTGFYGWVHSNEIMAGASPGQWSDWITQWAIPVLLAVSLWLLAMRLSRREAARFGDAAQALASEARTLETRLTVVNRELSLAREFLAEQSRELDFLGRSATERISTHAEKLQALVRDNGAQVDAIASVSQTALENMDRLRDDLPVIANSARDVSNRIGGAGREAQVHLQELIDGFVRLNEFGQASEVQVVSLKARIGQALGAFEQQALELEAIADSRFAALREASETYRAELNDRETEELAAVRKRAADLAEEIREVSASLVSGESQALLALQVRLSSLREDGERIAASVRDNEAAAMDAWNGQVAAARSRLGEMIDEIQRIDSIALENSQKKLAALREEAERVDANLAGRNRKFLEELASRRQVFAEDEEAAIAALTEQLDDLDSRIVARREQHLVHAADLAEQSEIIAQRLASFGTVLASIADAVADAEKALDSGSQQLQVRLGESRRSLAETQAAVGDLTEASVRLLELIHAGSEHSKGDLVKALSLAEGRLGEVEQRGQDLRMMLEETAQKGKSLSDYVIRAKDVSAETSAHLDILHSRFVDATQIHHQELTRLQEGLVTLEQQSEALSARTRGELQLAISALEEATLDVSKTLVETSQESIATLAETVGEESARAVERALSAHTQEAIAALEQAASRAASTSRDAASQLRTQLGKVNELAGNLESRVARARERAEEQVGNDFSRRMAMITESLNSASIDIAKALTAEVPDTTWASYLKGDRGIFTRRAVKLLDTVELRDIAEIYDRDPEFRDNVSHYIADFESMLRTMLSTRDGNALGVTILGSDMGKLYVALAQAIERLRD